MNTARRKITAEDYKIYKQLLLKPADDERIHASFGLPVRTAREIRLSKNYRGYRRELRRRSRNESLMAKTRLDFIVMPHKKVDIAKSNQLDREAEKTSRIVGWIGLMAIILVVLLALYGVIKSANTFMGCR